MTLPSADAIWSSLPVPAFLIDGEGQTVAANPAAEVFLNLSERAIRRRPLAGWLSGGIDLPAICARVRANRSDLFVSDVAVRAGTRGQVRCSLQAAPVDGGAGEVIVLLQPSEHADRLGLAREPGRAARSAIGMAEMLAHEIKNPLAGIAGAAQLLSMSLKEADRELTDLIVAETRRIVKLLDQVDQFGKLRPPERRAVNIHNLLDRARRSAELGFAARMRFVEDYDPSLPASYGDPDQLLQVFQNILKNAAQAAGPKGGTIRLKTYYDVALRIRRADGTGQPLPLQVEIADDGPGIPEAIAGQIFEPFVSGRENGTGLGLALVSRILADHGAWIAVESVPGRTVFRVSLPAAPPSAEVP